MTAKVLYTPEMLALATSLARWPLDPALPLTGQARSPTCGSTVKVGLATADGAIAGLGLRVQACAIGQAAAAIFADAAFGWDGAALSEIREQIVQWLTDAGGLPRWSGLSAIEAARGYPARHGAILLPWTAALAALGSAPRRG